MNFNNMVAPIMALNHSTDSSPTIGSGFLAQLDGEIFLVTVAHLGDPVLAPRADWSLWPDKLLLADRAAKEDEEISTEAELVLFDAAPTVKGFLDSSTHCARNRDCPASSRTSSCCRFSQITSS
ncbi:hypothetical protein [Pseudarthrobacter enclensis]|uniref:Uncharacterized protein n=1 Tax=Pseudarthrobacter enclensis TaxID=993070 RepID=A0ABT9S0E9_9MICC|nr:hypothetical protein [Pseudarthrobacter enclensis]MDP9890802.1 hypothetical protein [Pseudarthrobacter enclensis]